MIDRHDVTITIGGKSYTLSGVESETYLKEVAAYINDKLRGFSDDSSYWKLSSDMRSVMLQLNLADDFFKERDNARQLEIELSQLKSQAASELDQLKGSRASEIEQLKEGFMSEVRQMRDRLSEQEREIERLRAANEGIRRERDEARNRLMQAETTGLSQNGRNSQGNQSGMNSVMNKKLDSWQSDIENMQRVLSRMAEEMQSS